jgi:hypothetical protein
MDKDNTKKLSPTITVMASAILQCNNACNMERICGGQFNPLALLAH